MLQGFTKRKLASYARRQVGAPLEDMITAGVIGGLAFMPDEWAQRIYPRLFSNLEFVEQPIQWPTTIQSATVNLWPGGGLVEPDALISLSGDNAEVRIILEAKWNSGFSDQQAIRQWETFHGGPSHWHLLVVRDLHSAEEHIEHVRLEAKRGNADPLLGRRICAITWHQLALNLGSLHGDAPLPLRFWATQAEETLRAFGERLFSGFKAGRTEIAAYTSSLRLDEVNWPRQAIEALAVQWCPSKR